MRNKGYYIELINEKEEELFNRYKKRNFKEKEKFSGIK